MLKPITFSIVAAIGVAVFSSAVNAKSYRNGGRPYALEYCQFYKTRAMYAGHKARNNPHIQKHRRRAISMWHKYSHCLKDNGWPVTFTIPTYR